LEPIGDAHSLDPLLQGLAGGNVVLGGAEEAEQIGADDHEHGEEEADDGDGDSDLDQGKCLAGAGMPC
jgi:hypothetical protein